MKLNEYLEAKAQWKAKVDNQEEYCVLTSKSTDAEIVEALHTFHEYTVFDNLGELHAYIEEGPQDSLFHVMCVAYYNAFVNATFRGKHTTSYHEKTLIDTARNNLTKEQP
jgi:hypothetical protein